MAVIRKRRFCPVCGGRFKPMIDRMWKMNLYIHLTSSTKHLLSRKQAEKIIEKEES